MNSGHGGSFRTVGLTLVRELRARDHDVASMDFARQPDEMGFSARPDVQPRCVRGDVAEYRQLERVSDRLGPFDLVYRAAAELGRWNGVDFTEILWRTLDSFLSWHAARAPVLDESSCTVLNRIPPGVRLVISRS